mmetsp:Transcript_85526/g.264820  ORF Transcript_85526/g.264820 Transcript_85526/m.264820 type:complete len:208 (-) Transcript_85526:45-668(-)
MEAVDRDVVLVRDQVHHQLLRQEAEHQGHGLSLGLSELLDPVLQLLLLLGVLPRRRLLALLGSGGGGGFAVSVRIPGVSSSTGPSASLRDCWGDRRGPAYCCEADVALFGRLLQDLRPHEGSEIESTKKCDEAKEYDDHVLDQDVVLLQPRRFHVRGETVDEARLEDVRVEEVAEGIDAGPGHEVRTELRGRQQAVRVVPHVPAGKV